METGDTTDRIGTEQDSDGGGIVRFGVSMPAALLQQFDAWLRDRQYANRSEAVRDLVRDSLVDQDWADEDTGGEAVGVVTLVYRHSVREVSDNLIEMQHHHHTVAQATLHIHLSPENCLEVIVLRGTRAEVVSLANQLISAQGVLHGKFVPTTSGAEIV